MSLPEVLRMCACRVTGPEFFCDYAVAKNEKYQKKKRRRKKKEGKKKKEKV